jgi:hypothetical protein
MNWQVQAPLRYRSLYHTFQKLQNYYVIRKRNRWATGRNLSKIISYYISGDTSERLTICLLDKKLKLNSIKMISSFHPTNSSAHDIRIGYRSLYDCKLNRNIIPQSEHSHTYNKKCYCNSVKFSFQFTCLSTMSWRHMGKRRHSSMHSLSRHYIAHLPHPCHN